MRTTIKLATKPGIPNVNGYTYSKKEIERIIYSKGFQEVLNRGYMPITISNFHEGKSSLSDLLSTKVEEIIGKVISIDIEQGTAKISIDDDLFRICYPNNKIEDFVLGMNYLGNTEDPTNIHIDRIIYYMLINKEVLNNVRDEGELSVSEEC